ncbi:MAG: TlpA family protein disulfide reductase [Acidobacteriia bacterium]|nr:TlpA family protein disulfide reductase [Terriglobia bacterium]
MRKRKLWMALLVVLAVMPALFLVLAQKSLKGFQGLHPGDAVPHARLQPVGRSSIDTGSWRGSPTLLVVFQPGCESCRLEIRSLASIAPSFPEVRIALLSTGSDSGGMRAPFPIYIDPEGRFLAKVRKLVTPALYWIDPAGQVRYARTGQRNAHDEEMLFRKMLGGDRQRVDAGFSDILTPVPARD